MIVRVRRTAWLSAALCLLASLAWTPAAPAEIASSQFRPFQAGLLDVGAEHTCAVLASGELRCWGNGANGRLGYGNTNPIGDNELPDTVGPVQVGAGRTVRTVATGDHHTCALLDNGTVRCWGEAINGKLGYGSAVTTDVGDNEFPNAVGPVDLGAGRTARAISAGASHTCALLDDATVRCWGSGADGRLGYQSTADIGDDETPGSHAPVVLPGDVKAISAGGRHTCAILVDGSLYCWGFGNQGRLGYGNENNIGVTEDPRDAGPVPLGTGRTAQAISADSAHTCALLDDGTVRCWGNGSNGKLGYGNTGNVGDGIGPSIAVAGPVDLGTGRTARAIASGGQHTCAILDNDAVRCWGQGFFGALGYGNTNAIGDNETPGTAGPVNLGAGRTARAIDSGGGTCALLDIGALRCWGDSTFGQLGYGNTTRIGNDETPDTVGPVQLGGLMTSGRGDSALTLTADATTRQVGQDVALTATLSSGGPEAVEGAAATVTLPPGLQFVRATTTAGTFAGGVLAVPSLSVGSTAVLTVVARVAAPGTQTASVEVTGLAPSFLDLDSTPNNHAAGEDDQASVAITATNAAANPRPVLSALSMLRRTFAVGPGRTSVTARRLTPRGSSFRFTLSERSTVTILIERKTTGRRVGRRCVAPTRRNRTRRHCTRYTRSGLLTRRNLAAGKRTVTFTGRIGRKALSLGSYRATLTPTDTTRLRGTARSITFTIKRR